MPTRQELAAELSVTCQTLYDLPSQGRGPRGFRAGRRFRRLPASAAGGRGGGGRDQRFKEMRQATVL